MPQPRGFIVAKKKKKRFYCFSMKMSMFNNI